MPSFQLGGEVGLVGVDGPFGDVAMHVIEAPGVGLFEAHFLVGEVAVVDEPGILRELRDIVAEGVGGGGSGAAGVFPFCFGGEAVEVSRLGGEPLAKFGGGVIGHVHRGVLGSVRKAPVHEHVVVLNGGLGDGIDEGRFFEVGLFDGVAVIVPIETAVFVAGFVKFGVVLPERVVKAPGDFGGGDPEGGEFDCALFCAGVAEQNLAAGNGDQFERTILSLGDFLGVVFELLLLGLFGDEGVQAFGELELFGRGKIFGRGWEGWSSPSRRKGERRTRLRSQGEKDFTGLR